MSDSNKDNRKNHLVALFATVLFHAVVIVVLLSVTLRHVATDEERTWPPIDSSEVLLGGEYVMIGERPEMSDLSNEPAPNEAESELTPSPEVESLENSGEVGQPAPVISSEQPSPAKTEKKTTPEKVGPTQAEIEAAEKAKREEETRQAIAGKVKFGNVGTGGNSTGNSGSPDGNSTVGAVSGSPGYNLKGRTLADWHLPASAPLGSITIRVSVNRQGKVTSATYQSGTGAAASNIPARQSCVNAALRSQFSVDEDAPASQVGTITYNFK